MAVQVKTDNNPQPFVLHGQAYVEDKTLLAIGARSTVLKKYTVLAEIAATGKLAPFTSVSGTDGTAIPCYIYVGEEIPAATIAAGDVTDLRVISGGNVVVDEDQVIFDGGTLTAASVIGASSVWAQTVRKVLKDRGIILKGTDDISAYEN